jgi:uncharacterized delta-60 repeat protein
VLVGFGAPASGGGKPQAAVARFTTAGTLDTTFNGTGTFIDDVFGSTIGSVAWGVAFDASGNIYVSGVGQTPSGTAIGAFLLRLTSGGTLDHTFGTGGTVTSTEYGGHYGLVVGNGTAYTGTTAIDGGNGIVLAGYGEGGAPSAISNLPGLKFGRAPLVTNAGVLVGVVAPGVGAGVARFAADGGVDTVFGTAAGYTIESALVYDPAYMMSTLGVQCDGKILFAGRRDSADASAGQDLAAIRLTATGAVDDSYGSSGIVSSGLPGNDIAAAATVDSQGRLVVAGRNGSGHIILWRFNP